MTKAIVIIIVGLSVIQIIRFGWSKLVYNFFSLFLIFLIFGRIACEKVLCLWYLPKYLISLVFTKIKCLACAGYEPDWSLRGGIDEAGLILTGALVFVQVLSIKNIKIRDLVRNIKKVTLLGAFEAELLDQKVTNYSKKELDQIDQDVIKRFEKIEDKIIEKTKQGILESSVLLTEKVMERIYNLKILLNW